MGGVNTIADLFFYGVFLKNFFVCLFSGIFPNQFLNCSVVLVADILGRYLLWLTSFDFLSPEPGLRQVVLVLVTPLPSPLEQNLSIPPVAGTSWCSPFLPLPSSLFPFLFLSPSLPFFLPLSLSHVYVFSFFYHAHVFIPGRPLSLSIGSLLSSST